HRLHAVLRLSSFPIARSAPRRPSFLSMAPPPPDAYTLSLHDALPISVRAAGGGGALWRQHRSASPAARDPARHGGRRITRSRRRDRKSTRLNSSHVKISYAVLCLKQKKRNKTRC